MRNPFNPPPAPPDFAKGKILPEEDTSYLSRLVFQWITPFLDVGYSRPLQEEDLWELPQDKLTENLTNTVEANFYARCPPDKRPVLPYYMTSQGEKGSETPALSTDESDPEKAPVDVPSKTQRRLWFHMKPSASGIEAKVYDSSLVKALHTTFWFNWWAAGILKLLAEVLRTTTPIVSKVILTWLSEAYIYHALPDKLRVSMNQPRGIGYGIGLAFALFVMQEVASLLTNHYSITAMKTGLVVRSAVTGAIFRKSLRLSARARLDHSVGQITNMISTDAARLDISASFAHTIWIGPIQIAICIGLLIGNLGYSALVGLGVLIFGFPLQMILVRVIFKQRGKGAKITDARVRLTTEVLQGIRLIKLYAWEQFYVGQIGKLRRREIKTVRNFAMARSGLIATVTFIPVLATILSFITYALSGHNLNAAIIFSSLQLFNIIRQPMMFFPFVFSLCSDALVALRRIGKFLAAEELQEPYTIEHHNENAVEVDGDFTWEIAGSLTVDTKEGHKDGLHRDSDTAVADKGVHSTATPKPKRRFFSSKVRKDHTLPTAVVNGDESGNPASKDKEVDEKPFELLDLKLRIPKGLFVAIVGRVGCGKSSVLQALIGEMRRTKGKVVFGGSVAYVPQTAWIRNATLRKNITFGQNDDENRFRDVIHACSLEHDLEMLPHGEETEIGEKGINLSGQKARVSLARAAYSRSDVILLDDPLSAVDAYVGKTILEDCLLNGPLSGTTRVLVTHALHVLDKMDYIYVMDHGKVIEQGTYDALLKESVLFSRLISEYGHTEQENANGSDGDKAHNIVSLAIGKEDKKADTHLMQAEERNTGAVTWDVYSKYLQFAGGRIWAPFIVGLLILNQGALVGNNLFLGFWTARSIPGYTQGEYMGVYTGLGAATALLSFLISFSFSLSSLVASLRLSRAALSSVLRSPAAFFDTTPIGRILSRLSKDQDTLDTELSLTLFQLMSTFSMVIGTVALVFYTFPLLGILFAPLSVLYWVVAKFYRSSSVETKRLDSLMRSALYSSYSETLTGLSTIRAYREQSGSIRSAEQALDLQNRAYYMTIAIQRWLAVRLDFFGNILVFGIALFAAGFRNTVNPAKIGVVLSYTLNVTQTFSEMVSQFATNEQNMNAVERVLVYSELPPEGDAVTPNDPPPTWPDQGGIAFTNVQMAYREGLPLVLKSVSFQIKPGEKVGIVGRTGAGKSSLLQALFRIVEVQEGEIEIDGYNTRNIGLDVLRRRLALVPQDSTLFLGTLRENLDPQGSRTDAELISALQRAWLLPRDGPTDPGTEAKFSLDSQVGDEGSNYSVGEKQLLALCRALVKNSRIIVLDEATSNVDVETDSRLQKTIQTEFSGSTLLCIAHRLNTVAYYDRVLVMDRGMVAEFDTVLNLFDETDSIFRSLCNEAGLSRQDIIRIRADVASGNVAVDDGQ